MNPPGILGQKRCATGGDAGTPRARVELNVENDGSPGPMGRVELLAYVRRLAGILMERLEEGSREKTLDQAQTRMLSSTALKALRLWQQVLDGDDGSVKDLERVRQAKGWVEIRSTPV